MCAVGRHGLRCSAACALGLCVAGLRSDALRASAPLAHPTLPCSPHPQSGALAYGMKLDDRLRLAPNVKLRASRKWAW